MKNIWQEDEIHILHNEGNFDDVPVLVFQFPYLVVLDATVNLWTAFLCLICRGEIRPLPCLGQCSLNNLVGFHYRSQLNPHLSPGMGSLQLGRDGIWLEQMHSQDTRMAHHNVTVTQVPLVKYQNAHTSEMAADVSQAPVQLFVVSIYLKLSYMDTIFLWWEERSGVKKEGVRT